MVWVKSLFVLFFVFMRGIDIKKLGSEIFKYRKDVEYIFYVQGNFR